MTRMRAKYEEEVRKALMEKFGYKSPMQIPKLDKIIVNIGVGEAKDNAKALEAAVSDLAIITGQKPVITKAKKSVANFKIREGMNLGCKVTVYDETFEEEVEYQIVGSTESNPIEGRISNESPVGVALLGKKVGDTASVETPTGVCVLKVLKISK